MIRRVLHCVLPMVTLAAESVSAQVITVQLPAELESPRGAVQVALLGQGMCLQRVDMRAPETRIDVEKLAQRCAEFHDLGPIREIRMLALVPGTGVESFSGPAVDGIWKPNLVLLPVVRVHGRLEPPPPVGSTVRFSYGSTEGMRFFGYADGAPPEIAIGATSVGVAGEFSLEVPTISADPFVQDDDGMVDVHVVHAGDSARPLGDHWASMPLEEFYAAKPLLEVRRRASRTENTMGLLRRTPWDS